MKHEARVFEITSPTKLVKLSFEYVFSIPVT